MISTSSQEREPNSPDSPRESESDRAPADGLTNERRIPSVNRARSLQSRVTTILTITVMCALALALLAWYYARALSEDTPAASNRTARRASTTADTFLPALTGVPEPPPADPHSSTAAVPTKAPARAATRGRQTLIVDRRLTAPVFARPHSGAAAVPRTRAPSASSISPAGLGVERTPEEGDGTDLSSLLRSTGHRSTTASRLTAPHMTLRAGTHIPCTLETAITSSLPGATRCITAADTWSADGSVVLIERGTTIFGETRSVASQGNHRLFIVWSHAYTPQHIVVPLEAPGTDALGRSGVTGEVNYHFFQRFGAALLISVIDGVVQAASRSRTGNNSIAISPNPSRDLLAEILRQTANIRPTVDVHQGARVQVAVPRNVDFGAVYELMQSDEL
jgi:type IV secretion system protein VirB10